MVRVRSLIAIGFQLQFSDLELGYTVISYL